MKFAEIHEISSILLVGVAPRNRSSFYDNIIEEGLIATKRFEITTSGLEDDGNGWPNWLQADGLCLPFPNRSFDLVLSNAVLEHVGNEQDQMKFVLEHTRVGKKWLITTPNRFFPIESHTHIVLRHMRRGWSFGSVTRLLSKSEFKSLLPQDSKVVGSVFLPTFLAHN